jgi:hypothetical protein
MPSIRPGLRALAVAATATAVGMLPAPAQAASAPQLSLIVPDLEATAPSPLTPWTYLRLEASPDWWGPLHNTRLEIDATGITGVATAFVPAVGSDGTIEPDDHQCRRQGAITTCKLGTRAPTSWFPLPFIVVQAAPGAEVGRSGTLRVTVTGDTESGVAVGPLVATPTVTVRQ